jgi:hypothetical protein
MAFVRYKAGKMVPPNWFAANGLLLQYIEVDTSNQNIYYTTIDFITEKELNKSKVIHIINNIDFFLKEGKLEIVSYENEFLSIYDFI